MSDWVASDASRALYTFVNSIIVNTKMMMMMIIIIIVAIIIVIIIITIIIVIVIIIIIVVIIIKIKILKMHKIQYTAISNNIC